MSKSMTICTGVRPVPKQDEEAQPLLVITPFLALMMRLSLEGVSRKTKGKADMLVKNTYDILDSWNHAQATLETKLGHRRFVIKSVTCNEDGTGSADYDLVEDEPLLIRAL